MMIGKPMAQKVILEEDPKPSKLWYVYILECHAKPWTGIGYLDTYYTGITTDLEKRFKAHSSGRGAKYTRNKKVIKFLYIEKFETKSAASKREYAIKKLSRAEKEALIESNPYGNGKS